MKICHILGSLGMGGAERVALDLGMAQAALGHEVSVMVLSPIVGSAMEPEFRESGLPLMSVPKKPGLDFRLPLRVARALRARDIEIAHTHNTQPLVYAAAAARLSGHRVVHTKHGQGHLVSHAGQLLRRVGAPFVHHFVCVSEATKEHALQQKAFPFADRISVITNGIRLDRHAPSELYRQRIRESLQIPADAFVVGSVGRVDENKNHRDLLRALDADLSNDLHLIIVGDGAQLPALRKQRESSSKPQSIHLLGRRQDANQIIAALDVFALPSKSEGLPLVLLEAMATKVAVVSTAVGGIPDVIDHENTGLLVPPGNAKALRDGIFRLREDRDLAERCREGAFERVAASYSATSMAKAYLALYES